MLYLPQNVCAKASGGCPDRRRENAGATGVAGQLLHEEFHGLGRVRRYAANWRGQAGSGAERRTRPVGYGTGRMAHKTGQREWQTGDRGDYDGKLNEDVRNLPKFGSTRYESKNLVSGRRAELFLRMIGALQRSSQEKFGPSQFIRRGIHWIVSNAGIRRASAPR